MKKEAKNSAVIEQEKKEAQELRDKILSATNSIPRKILDHGSYQSVTTFKAHAIAARKVAESKAGNLTKLLAAWSLIQGYYA